MNTNGNEIAPASTVCAPTISMDCADSNESSSGPAGPECVLNSAADPPHPAVSPAGESLKTNDAPAAPPQTVSPVSALQQLIGEPYRAYSILLRYASVFPHPELQEFARQNGVSRNSLSRWKKAYRWDERLAEYQQKCSLAWTAPIPQQPQVPEEEDTPERAMRLDLRANVMRLARIAMESWEPETHPTSLQGVVRAFELACKLNPPPPTPDAVKQAASARRYAEFMARLDKIYGPDRNVNVRQTL